MAPTSVPVNITPIVPTLRVFRRLDTDQLSEDFIEKVTIEEDDVEYVDANRARDDWQTAEIMASTIGAALVDPDGNIVAEFDGPDGFVKAERARASARVTFDMELDVEDDEDFDDADLAAGGE